jgi:hypothetical protein
LPTSRITSASVWPAVQVAFSQSRIWGIEITGNGIFKNLRRVQEIRNTLLFCNHFPATPVLFEVVVVTPSSAQVEAGFWLLGRQT